MPDAEGTTPDSQMRKRRREDEDYVDTNDDDDDDEEDAETNGENDSDDEEEEEEDETQVEEVGGDVNEAKDFVAWCRKDGQSDEEEEEEDETHQKRVKENLGKLKREKTEGPHHFSLLEPRLRCGGCKDDQDACERCKVKSGACEVQDCEACQTGKWARYAIKLRFKASVCAIDEQVYDIIEGKEEDEGLCGGWDKDGRNFFWSDGRWSWDANENCTCESCRRVAPKLQGEARALFLYREKLVRAKPWFDEDTDFTLKQDGSLPDVLKRAVDHWDFFSGLQEHAFKYADKPYEIISRKHSDLQELIDKLPEALLDEKGEYMNRDCHSTIAALNELRRRQSRRPKNNNCRLTEAFKRLIPKFEENYELYNFEGTEEDNYCLGSRGTISLDDGDGEFSGSTNGAIKWYIGTTMDKFRRHKEHAGNDPRTESRSSSFVRLMTHRMQIRQADDFGGWQVVDGKQDEAFKVEQKKEGQWTTLDEDNLTERMSIVFGQRHVRGGIYTSTEFDSLGRFTLERKRRQFLGRCFKCGGEHFSANCESEPDEMYKEWTNKDSRYAAHVQSADEDEALSTLKGLNVAYEGPDEESDDYFKRARDVAKAFRDKFGGNGSDSDSDSDSGGNICRAVIISSGKEVVEHIGDGSGEHEELWYRLVRAIWPPPPPLPPSTGSDIPAPQIDDDGVAGRLRPKQKEALRRVCSKRDDLVLSLPTAYGKTRIFLTAAVHEVLYGRGKAVILLPYKALMADISSTFEEISKGLMGSVAQSYAADPRVRGTATAYGGSMYVLNPETRNLRKITWTRWQGRAGDGNMRQHEQSDEFKNADIVLATPDKWMLPISSTGKGAQACDSFVSTFEKHASKFGLAVIDEAHQFTEVLGGSTCELLRRMRLLCKLDTSETKPFRVMLASATITDPKGFADKLLPKSDRQQRDIVIKAEEGQGQKVEVGPAKDVERMLNDAKQCNADGRHRLLLFHRGKLGITEVCNNLLTYDALGKNDVRRVLLFCDSKQLAARFVDKLRTKRFKEKSGWDANGFDVFATPYHGDCANLHRRVYERLFGGWVRKKSSSQRGQLHVIVATSALEAGVNICGPDVIIVLDAATCSRDSLVQRIGRGGRVGGRPAVVVIGVDPTELPRLLDDVETDEHDGERSAIERYLLDDADESPPVVKTRVMRVHGARQHVRNLQRLEKLNWTGLRQRDGRADSSVKKLLDDFDIEDGAKLEEMEKKLDDEGKRETPLFDRDYSARGMGFRTITLRKVTRDGRYERPYRVRDDEERRVPNAFVEVACLDAIRALKFAHPRAHYMEPHGKIYCVHHHVYDDGTHMCRSDDWLSQLKAVGVFPISPAQDQFTRTDHYYCTTESEWDTQLEYKNQNTDSVDEQLSRGTFTWTMTWKSFTYKSRFDGSKVETIDASEIDLDEGVAFRKPVKRDLGGWQWCVRVGSEGEGKYLKGDLNELVRLELWLRFAKELGCSVQQIEVNILDEKDEPSEADAHELESQNTSSSIDDSNDVIRLQMVEHSTIGLPSEALRKMKGLLRLPKLLLKDRTWSKRLYDKEPERGKIDEHEDKVEDAIKHLYNRWDQDYPDGWKLPRS